MYSLVLLLLSLLHYYATTKIAYEINIDFADPLECSSLKSLHD